MIQPKIFCSSGRVSASSLYDHFTPAGCYPLASLAPLEASASYMCPHPRPPNQSIVTLAWSPNQRIKERPRRCCMPPRASRRTMILKRLWSVWRAYGESKSAYRAHVRYEGNPCNRHILGLGQRVKRSLMNAGLIGYQFGTVGVSDGISMGTRGSE